MIQNLNELRKCEYIIVRKIEDKYYMLGQGKCFELNETGVLVVKYIGKNMLISEFCKKLAQKYEGRVQIEQIERDIELFIDFLIKNRLIETV